MVSVVMTSFNHEKYIGSAIESILAQSLRNYELIIVDDGSSDKSREIIKQYKDERIKTIFQSNQGPSMAFNAGFEVATGSYIALMSGDDICYPERLEKQLQYSLEHGASFVFALPDIINESGVKQEDFVFPVFYNVVASNQVEIFRHLFYHGNFLCAPTAFFSADVIRNIGGFHLSSIQLQDFDMWVRAIKHYNFAIMQERLIQYRVRDNQMNLSNENKVVRIKLEQLFIYKSFFEGMPIGLFKKAFPDTTNCATVDENVEIELDKSFIYLTHSDSLIQSIALERLFFQMNDSTFGMKLRNERNFSSIDLYEIMNKVDITQIGEIKRLKSKFFPFQKESQFVQRQYKMYQEERNRYINNYGIYKRLLFWIKFFHFEGYHKMKKILKKITDKE